MMMTKINDDHFMEQKEELAKIVESCKAGRHVIAVIGAQGTGKSNIAKSIFAALNEAQQTCREQMLFIDELEDPMKVKTTISLFHDTKDGICIFTHHAKDRETLIKSLRGALMETGCSNDEAEELLSEFVDVCIHMVRNNSELNKYEFWMDEISTKF